MSSNINHDKKILELLEIMICPKTGGRLFYDKDNQELVSKKGKIDNNEKITASSGTIESRVTYERYPE